MLNYKIRARVCFAKGADQLHIWREIKEIFDFSNDNRVHMSVVGGSMNQVYNMNGIRVIINILVPYIPNQLQTMHECK
jgi:hypothetical protein